MATYIALISETQQGEANIQDTVTRAKQFEGLASELGVTVKGLYWTMGSVDGVLVLDAPDEETVAGLTMKLMAQGNVRTHTMRAFDAAEMKKILGQ